MAETPETRWHLLPITGWLPHYQKAWLRFDLIAGVTLAAYAVPVSLAYAAINRHVSLEEAVVIDTPPVEPPSRDATT
jgi:MFS superfamily sulfate permease-like transporter